MKRTLVAVAMAIGFVSQRGSGQTTRAADSRFYPFVGCWRIDSAETAPSRDALSCVVPVASSADVELVDLLDGQIVNRRRLDASGRPRAIDEQGCRGQEQASWSVQPRRVYLHSEFVCTPTGIAGGKTTLMSILPSGEWVNVESVRAGGGSITRVERRRDAGLPASVPREIAGRIGSQRLALMTARAEAAAPLNTGDVIEALHHTDSSVVRAWLLTTAQHFQLSGDEVASLVRANVPAPVLQAMMSTAPAYQLGVGVDGSGRSTDAYLSSPGVPAGGAGQVYIAGQPQTPQTTVNVYDGSQQQPGYDSYGYYSAMSTLGTYYPGLYGAPYYFSYGYGAPYLYRRTYAPAGSVVHRSTSAPAYHSNPVGVRAGQAPASAPRQVPSRRRP